MSHDEDEDGLPRSPSMLSPEVILRSPRLVSWGMPSVCWRIGCWLTITPDSLQGLIAAQMYVDPPVQVSGRNGTSCGSSSSFINLLSIKIPTFCPYWSRMLFACTLSVFLSFAAFWLNSIPVMLIPFKEMPAWLPLTPVHVLPSFIHN